MHVLTQTHLEDPKKFKQIFIIFTFFHKARIIKLFSFTFKTLWDSSVFKISVSLNRHLQDNQLSFLPEGVFRNLRCLVTL